MQNVISSCLSLLHYQKTFFFYLSLQVEIAPDDLANLILSIFLLQWSDHH